MKRLSLLPIFLFALLSPASFASVQCTQSEARTAEVVTDYLDSWDNVYLFFKQFGQCYDASIAEGADDKIQLLWANHWQDLHRMLELTVRDPKFKEFLWQRVGDEDFPADRHAKILRYVRTSCPKSGTEFCQTFVGKAARGRP